MIDYVNDYKDDIKCWIDVSCNNFKAEKYYLFLKQVWHFTGAHFWMYLPSRNVGCILVFFVMGLMKYMKIKEQKIN